jgi:competence ComEA-like helix-hairpin-helix protein
MFKKLSVLIGLTETEIKILLFLLSAFVIGFSYRTYFLSEEINIKEYDYSLQDSLFFNLVDHAAIIEEDKQEEKSVDYKREVLDFNTTDFSENNKAEFLSERSINLNTANIDELILLPGIGEKTAERIIELRNKRGSFKFLEELLDIKGIGETKFRNLKKYLYL